MLPTWLEERVNFGFQALTSSKAFSPYTQLFLTHIDEQGRSTPPIVLSHFTEPNKAVNIPEFVDLDALRPGHDQSAWPGGQVPPPDKRHPGVEFDAAEPLFAQMGEDARTATAERGEKHIGQLVEIIAARIADHLDQR